MRWGNLAGVPPGYLPKTLLQTYPIDCGGIAGRKNRGGNKYGIPLKMFRISGLLVHPGYILDD
jgi:hypothetical protein